MTIRQRFMVQQSLVLKTFIVFLSIRLPQFEFVLFQVQVHHHLLHFSTRHKIERDWKGQFICFGIGWFRSEPTIPFGNDYLRLRLSLEPREFPQSLVENQSVSDTKWYFLQHILFLAVSVDWQQRLYHGIGRIRTRNLCMRYKKDIRINA